jgi:hypothetical protein
MCAKKSKLFIKVSVIILIVSAVLLTGCVRWVRLAPQGDSLVELQPTATSLVIQATVTASPPVATLSSSDILSAFTMNCSTAPGEHFEEAEYGTWRNQYTPTPYPVFTPPVPGAISPPPDNIFDWPAAMVMYLNANAGDLAFFEQVLNTWSNENDYDSMGITVDQVDLTDDGKEELLILIDEQWFGGLAIIKQNLGDDYYLAYAAFDGTPKIESIEDLDGDGRAELIYSNTVVGAHTIGYSVIPLQWDGQAFIDLSGDYIGSTYVNMFRLEDIDDDGKVEIIINGGIIGSLGAGPTRNSTLTYSLQEGRYVLQSKIPDPIDEKHISLHDYYFIVLDSHRLFMRCDFDRAIRSLEHALALSEQQGIGFEEMDVIEINHMRAFAEYQLLLAYLVKGDIDGARKWAASGYAPDAFYTQVRLTFWHEYQKNQDWESAVRATRMMIRQSEIEKMQLLSNVGYGNRELTLEEVCPCPGCQEE